MKKNTRAALAVTFGTILPLIAMAPASASEADQTHGHYEPSGTTHEEIDVAGHYEPSGTQSPQLVAEGYWVTPGTTHWEAEVDPVTCDSATAPRPDTKDKNWWKQLGAAWVGTDWTESQKADAKWMKSTAIPLMQAYDATGKNSVEVCYKDKIYYLTGKLTNTQMGLEPTAQGAGQWHEKLGPGYVADPDVWVDPVYVMVDDPEVWVETTYKDVADPDVWVDDEFEDVQIGSTKWGKWHAAGLDENCVPDESQPDPVTTWGDPQFDLSLSRIEKIQGQNDVLHIGSFVVPGEKVTTEVGVCTYTKYLTRIGVQTWVNGKVEGITLSDGTFVPFEGTYTVTVSGESTKEWSKDYSKEVGRQDVTETYSEVLQALSGQGDNGHETREVTVTAGDKSFTFSYTVTNGHVLESLTLVK